MTRTIAAGIALCTALAAAEYKLPFTCKETDILWAGMTCTERDPCPIYLDLTTAANTGSRIFVGGSIHSAQTTLFSVLISSDDSGGTWQESLERVRGEELNHIQFIDADTGWIGGQRVVPLPGDPFLQRTRDGGRTWKREALLPEGSPGFIQGFYFDSSQDGKLVIDRGTNEGDERRYRLFETNNGGGNWSVRESSGIPLKNAPVASEDPAWRVHADSGGRAFVLEHLLGDKWTVEARFPIQIAECKGEGLK